MNKHIITVTTPLEDIDAVIGRLEVADAGLVTLVGETSFEVGPNVDAMLEKIESQTTYIARQNAVITTKGDALCLLMQTVRQYIIDEELQDSDFAKTMIDVHGMDPFTRTARVSFTVTLDVCVDLADVPYDIDEDTLDEAVVEHVSENIGLSQQMFRIWVGDHHLTGDADVIDTDVTDSSVEFEG